MEGFYYQVMDLIRAEKERRGSYQSLCAPLGLKVTTVAKWFTEKFGDAPRSPNLLDVAKIMDSIGVLVRPAEDVLIQTSIEDSDHALEVQKLVEENHRLHEENEALKIKAAKLQGQVEVLKEFMTIPLSHQVLK